MTLDAFTQTPVFNWVIMPILIFAARVCDVSIGTIRILFIARGRKFLAPILGFFEVMIWLLAARQVIMNLTNFVYFFAFSGGFATGNYIGMLIEERLAMGAEVIRIITKNDVVALTEYFTKNGYGVTHINAQGATGPVHVIFSIFNRRDRQKIITDITQLSSKAFYTIEDIRSVNEGVFPSQQPGDWRRFLGVRQGK